MIDQATDDGELQLSWPKHHMRCDSTCDTDSFTALTESDDPSLLEEDMLSLPSTIFCANPSCDNDSSSSTIVSRPAGQRQEDCMNKSLIQRHESEEPPQQLTQMQARLQSRQRKNEQQLLTRNSQQSSFEPLELLMEYSELNLPDEFDQILDDVVHYQLSKPQDLGMETACLGEARWWSSSSSSSRKMGCVSISKMNLEQEITVIAEYEDKSFHNVNHLKRTVEQLEEGEVSQQKNKRVKKEGREEDQKNNGSSNKGWWHSLGRSWFNLAGEM